SPRVIAASDISFEYVNLNPAASGSIEPQQNAVLKILQDIRSGGFTLRSFLETAFNSTDDHVKPLIRPFYKNNGPEALVRCWAKNLKSMPETDCDMTFALAATDVAVNRARQEICNVSREKALQMPAAGITRDKIDSFSLETFEDLFGPRQTIEKDEDGNEERPQSYPAPCLGRILNGLGDSDSTFAVTATSMLLYMKNQRSNYLQMMHDSKRLVRMAVRKYPFMLLYDNINIQFSKHHQRINDPDSFKNGTTATIVICMSSLEEDPSKNKEHDHTSADPYADPSLDDLLPDKFDKAHLDKATGFYIFNVLCDINDEYDCYAALFATDPINLLPVVKTEAYELQIMDIDQSTREGNIRVLERAKTELALPDEWFTNATRVIIAGDLLTVSRIRTVKALRVSDVTEFHRLKWAVPYAPQDTLWLPIDTRVVGIFISALGRRRLNRDMPCYHTADELLNNVFAAMVRRLWQVELGFEDLGGLTSHVRRTLIAEAAAALEEVDEKVLKGRVAVRVRETIVRTINIIHEKYFTDSATMSKTFGSANVNAALFIRDMVIYKDFCRAIKAGDIGRIQLALKYATIMFQAGGTKNYAIELLRLHWGIHHVWTEKTTQAIFSSMLMNTKGKKDSWIPADLYQEHNNHLIKNTYAVRGSSTPWTTLVKTVSASIRVFSKIGSCFERQYGIIGTSSFHKVKDAEMDISTLVDLLKRDDILGADPQPQGFENLISGKFDAAISNPRGRRIE
ncbi:hypothetical protein BGX28_006417, partial [Mortierella sp. GBA30]